MLKPILQMEEAPSTADIESFWDILRDYNSTQAGAANYQKLYILLRDINNKIIGGLNGETYYQWLHIANLAVHEDYRKHGFGSQLLSAAEDEAVRRGCHSAYLDTYGFQSLPFYQKYGYEVFGILENCPHGHKRYFLKKQLVRK